MFKKIGLLAFLFGAYLYSNATELADNLTFKFSNLRFLKSGSNIFSTKLYVDLTLFNTTNVEANILGVTGNVYYNGADIGTYTIPHSFTIQAKKHTSTPIQISVHNATTLTSIVNSIIAKKKPAINIKGNIITSIGKVPFSETVI